jgi:putative ABC transport system ATP-binding protein
MADILISVQNVVKTYRLGGQDLHALRGVSLAVHRGEYVSIMGPSGSGKSTLFNMIGGLDVPTEGEVSVDGCRLSDLDSDQLAWFRCHKIGFIFQTFNLIGTMTAQENVAIARTFAGVSYAQALEDAAEVLDRVGLGHRLTHLPAQVSGGQQQRIAIARALVNKPLIILADEPTGNLDLRTGQDIITVLDEMKRNLGITVITATHDMKMISASDTLVRIRNGSVEEVLTKDKMNVLIGTIDGDAIA